MIIDSLKNSAIYEGMHPLFPRVFEFLRSTDMSSLPDGMNTIDGDELLVNVMQAASLKDPEDAKLEVHDKYIDIQVVLNGRESFGWTERSECSDPVAPMDREKDVQFFDDDHATRFTLKTGDFCILFPTDGHAPMIGSPGEVVKKCIFKVKV